MWPTRRYVLEQVDNPDRGAIYPVVLAMPAAAPGLSLTILPETLPSGTQSRSSALRARAAAWKRRPACVLCVERLEVSLPHKPSFGLLSERFLQLARLLAFENLCPGERIIIAPQHGGSLRIPVMLCDS